MLTSREMQARTAAMRCVGRLLLAHHVDRIYIAYMYAV